MEIELTVIDDKAEKIKGKVAVKPVTFFNIDFIEPIGEGVCNVSSGGKIFTAMESEGSVKNKIRDSNMREVSLMSNV